MSEIGAFEAKTHFSSLLERVANGEEITITKHGKPVARLVGTDRENRSNPENALERLKQLRRANTLSELSWQALRDEGRK